MKIIILGAGAAGLMCAIEAGKKGHEVILIDHAKSPGEKIRISGGGRCNFTNQHCTDKNFISENKHFCKSALKRYSASDFISKVDEHKIKWHEKNPDKSTGQLFCDYKSQQIIDMLIDECHTHNVQTYLETSIIKVDKTDGGFVLKSDRKNYTCDALVIATGGPSIPKMGASDFGYKIARQFGLKLITPEPALAPLTFTDNILDMTKMLSGVSIDSVLVEVDSNQKSTQFKDDLLFTHRGLSGPAILQISSYWSAGEAIKINLLPEIDLMAELQKNKKEQPKQKISKFLNQFLPARFVEQFIQMNLDPTDAQKNLADFSDKKFQVITNQIQSWVVKPNGTEGYRKAEVTRGGVNTNEIDARTFQSKKVSGLYFIGEVIDVTGHLGGHNFQWAWASGFCCGSEI